MDDAKKYAEELLKEVSKAHKHIKQKQQEEANSLLTQELKEAIKNGANFTLTETTLEEISDDDLGKVFPVREFGVEFDENKNLSIVSKPTGKFKKIELVEE